MLYKHIVLIITLLSSNIVTAASGDIQPLPYSAPISHWQQQRQIALTLMAGAFAGKLSTENIQSIAEQLDDRLLYVSVYWVARVLSSLPKDLESRSFADRTIKDVLRSIKQVKKPSKFELDLLNKIIFNDKYYVASSDEEATVNARAIISDTIKILSEQLI